MVAPRQVLALAPRCAIRRTDYRDVTTVPVTARPASRAAPPSRRKAAAPTRADPRLDWRRIAYNALVSRALDDVEEATNKNRATVPREHLVLYQFSARGHDVAQSILGVALDHPHDAASAYYRSRPLLLSLGLSIDDALGSPLGRAGGFSDGRDIGVVCNLPNRDGPIVLPMSGDVGSQYTPCAGWAQSIRYHTDVLGERDWEGAIGVVLGGEASVATNGFWSALTMATTLSLPMLFYIEDNGLGISVRGDMQTPGGDIARNLASFENLFIRDGDGTDPGGIGAAPRRMRRSRSRRQAVRRSCDSPCRGCAATRGRTISAAIAPTRRSRPTPSAIRCRGCARISFRRVLSETEWAALEARSRARRASGARRGARAAESGSGRRSRDGSTPTTRPARPRRSADSHAPSARRSVARRRADEDGDVVRFAEAVRRTLRHELEVNPKVVVFGEDVGRKGGVHLVTEGLQKQFGDAARVRHEPLRRRNHRSRRRHGDLRS